MLIGVYMTIVHKNILSCYFPLNLHKLAGGDDRAQILLYNDILLVLRPTQLLVFVGECKLTEAQNSLYTPCASKRALYRNHICCLLRKELFKRAFFAWVVLIYDWILIFIVAK